MAGQNPTLEVYNRLHIKRILGIEKLRIDSQTIYQIFSGHPRNTRPTYRLIFQSAVNNSGHPSALVVKLNQLVPFRELREGERKSEEMFLADLGVVPYQDGRWNGENFLVPLSTIL